MDLQQVQQINNDLEKRIDLLIKKRDKLFHSTLEEHLPVIEWNAAEVCYHNKVIVFTTNHFYSIKENYRLQKEDKIILEYYAKQNFGWDNREECLLILNIYLDCINEIDLSKYNLSHKKILSLLDKEDKQIYLSKLDKNSL